MRNEFVPPKIDRIDVVPATVAAFKTEDDFTGLAVSLMVEVGSYTCIAACTLGPSATWDRDRAAVGGNMVRLYKLTSAYLDQTCQRRGEISWVVGRLLFETAVNIKYLIQYHSKELVDSYIKHSLRQERQLFDKVQTNIRKRGSTLPI